MLEIHIIAVGRDKKRWITDQIDHYRKLISKYARLELTTVPEGKYGKTSEIDKSIQNEARSIRSKLKGGLLVVLDLAGKSYNTEMLAQQLAQWQVDGVSRIEFVIGGPYGLGRSFQGEMALSLSPFTFSHQIVRLILMEQLYRVLNINAGGNYHK